MDNVSVTLSDRDRNLTVSGKLEKPENLRYTERKYGEFNYIIPLKRFHLKFDAVTSSYDKGILTVELPLEEEKVKTIAVVEQKMFCLTSEREPSN
jgi:HSP20 family molecular chaperone IbpA